MPELIYGDETCRILGACCEVYRDKGCGFPEPIYQECLGIEFEFQNIPAIAQPGLQLEYRRRPLVQKYIPDFVCFGKIIVELKAVEHVSDAHRAQVLNYLRASRFELGLLINFGHYPKLEHERIANTRGKSRPTDDEEITL
jgi:GxxExxY protein